MSEPEAVDAEVVEEPEGATVAALAPVRATSALVEPAADTLAIRAAFQSYTALCGELLTDDDYQTFTNRGKRQRFKKKAAWRKLAVAFGVSMEHRGQTIERDDDGKIVRAEVHVRAVAPNGRFVDGIGVCATSENRDFAHLEHDVLATAHTRANNRACSDLFGMGEVSAEEVTDDRPERPRAEPAHDPDDGFVTTEQMARVRELTKGLNETERATLIKETDGGKAVTICGVLVRSGGNITLRQSQYQGLVDTLASFAKPTEAPKPDESDPEQAPFTKDDPADLTGTGTQPESTGKGFDNWSKDDVVDEVRERGVKVTTKKDGIKWLREHGVPETDERPY